MYGNQFVIISFLGTGNKFLGKNRSSQGQLRSVGPWIIWSHCQLVINESIQGCWYSLNWCPNAEGSFLARQSEAYPYPRSSRRTANKVRQRCDSSRTFGFFSHFLKAQDKERGYLNLNVLFKKIRKSVGNRGLLLEQERGLCYFPMCLTFVNAHNSCKCDIVYFKKTCNFRETALGTESLFHF